MRFLPRISLRLFLLAIPIGGAIFGLGIRWLLDAQEHEREDKALGRLKSQITVDHMRFDDQGFVSELTLIGTLTDDAWSELRQFHALRSIDYACDKPSRLPEHAISKLTGLETVHLQEVDLSTDAIAALARLPRLTKVDLDACHFDLDGLAAFHESKFLRVLKLELYERQLAQLPHFEPKTELAPVQIHLTPYFPKNTFGVIYQFLHEKNLPVILQNPLSSEECAEYGPNRFSPNSQEADAVHLANLVIETSSANAALRAAAYRIRGHSLFAQGNHKAAAADFQAYLIEASKTTTVMAP